MMMMMSNGRWMPDRRLRIVHKTRVPRLKALTYQALVSIDASGVLAVRQYVGLHR